MPPKRQKSRPKARIASRPKARIYTKARQTATNTMGRASKLETKLGGLHALATGTDALTTLNTLTNSAGQIIYSKALAPALIWESRLAMLSRIWERYALIEVRIRYVPIVEMRYSGTLVLAPDYDVADEAQVDEFDERIRDLVGTYGAQTTQVTQPCEVVFHGNLVAGRVLYADGRSPLRTSCWGRLMVAVWNPILTSAGVSATTTDVGNLLMDYRLHFHIPQLSHTAPSAYFASAAIQWDEGDAGGTAVGYRWALSSLGMSEGDGDAGGISWTIGTTSTNTMLLRPGNILEVQVTPVTNLYIKDRGANESAYEGQPLYVRIIEAPMAQFAANDWSTTRGTTSTGFQRTFNGLWTSLNGAIKGVGGRLFKAITADTASDIVTYSFLTVMKMLGY